MALVVKDRVKETTATTGTGTLTLAGAVAGFQSFSSALSDGDTTYYAIFESSTGVWEVGLGTFTASGTTLARTTILASSNAGSAVNLTAGSAEVFVTQPAGKAAYFDSSGDLVLNQDPSSALQAATKQYVDTIAAAGIHYHTPVRVESPSNLTATYDNGTSGVGATLTNSGTQAALVIDGVTLSTSDRVLIYTQTNAAHNGIYTVTDTGSVSTNWVLTRATDADSYGPSDPDSLGEGDAFFVSEGDTGAGELYVMNTSGTITFGTTDINFAIIAETAVYAAGAGLTLTGTTFAVGAGTGVTVNANDVAIGQAVGTGDNVTFNQVTAALVGNVTGDVTGDVTGNADTATTWQTSRTLTLSGDVTGTATGIDGSGNIAVTTTIAADSVALGTDTTGNYVSTGAVSGNGLSGSASAEGATFTVTSNATNANTASTIVFRDGSGNFSAGTITANLTGTASQATNADTVDSLHASQFLRSDASDSTSGDLTISGGQVYVGVNDSVAGELILYGAGTGTTEGAEIRLHASADYDGVIDLWSIDVNQDDLRMFTSAGDLAFVANPDGAVNLYYNGSKKFETTSGGALVSGVLDVSNRVESDDYRSATNQQIQIQAGESWNYSTGQTSEYVYVNAESGLQINCSPDNWSSGWAGRVTHTFDSSGLTVTGTTTSTDFNTTSDARLKTNVETLSTALDKVNAMRGVSFDWIESGSSEVGVIAQEVEAVIPELVGTNDDGIKSVKYGNMVAVLIEAIKEQQKQIDDLKQQLEKG